MSKKSVIIIGAGLAGLSTGCFAQINGYDSHIFEHHTVPGGVAATWKRKGYTIDGGIHFVMGHKPGTAIYNLYKQIGMAEEDTFVDYLCYGRFIDEENNFTIDITQDLNKLEKELKAIAPEDKIIIDDIIKSTRSMQGIDMSEIGMSKPPELTGTLDQLKDVWKMGGFMRFFTGKYARSIEEYVENIRSPLLKKIIKNIFMPEVPVWFIFMVLALLADGQLGLIRKGCLDTILSVEKNYKKLGGQISYKSPVKEIIVENHKATGIVLEDGTSHRADIIVSTADLHSTLFDMLKGRYIDSEIDSRFKHWKLCRPFLTLSYGVRREFSNLPVYNTILLKEPITIGQKPVYGFIIRLFNYSSSFAPEGKSIIQVEIETEWDYWNDLHRKNKNLYEEEKQQVAHRVLKCLEKYYPSISEQVEMTDIATPYTTWHYTRNHRGSWGGWLYTPEAFVKQTKRTLPGLENFYMAGHWIMMGVIGALYSGRHVVQILCHKDKKQFVTER